MKTPLAQQTKNQYTPTQNVFYFIVLILLLLCISFSAVIAQSNERSQITTKKVNIEKNTYSRLVLETDR